MSRQSTKKSTDDTKIDEEEKYIDTKSDKFRPTNNFVTPLLTDLYELTMTYSYFQLKKHETKAVFDVFFRRAPFKGTFAVFCGLEDVLRFVKSFNFSSDEIKWLKEKYPGWDSKFFDYLSKINCDEVKIVALEEGSVCFPRVPLLRVEGPLGIVQLLETTVLNCVNYASLVATTAARHRLIVGRKPILLEFGLRRAQGPDGGCSASRFSYIGGYNGTSNVQASHIYDVPCAGTHAHSYVCSFAGWQDFPRDRKLRMNPEAGKDGVMNLRETVEKWRKVLDPKKITHEGELAAFAAYALDFATGFLALIDTYNTTKSGMVNFAIVAMALIEAGYKPVGIRIDSGNLVQQSYEIRAYFNEIAEKHKMPVFSGFAIIASNDIDEEALEKLAKSEVTGYGVGTRLVTCKGNPALGGVYKLVELDNVPRIKLSSDRFKTTIPARKQCYRMYGKNDEMLCDVLTYADDKAPKPGCEIKVKDFFNPLADFTVSPVRVEKLLHTVWDKGEVTVKLPKIHELKKKCQESIFQLPPERTKRVSPFPYKVLLGEKLYADVYKMMVEATPNVRLA